MAADRFFTPFQQFLSADPDVREGARLFFFAAGTSTKLATYSDKDLSVANSNPIVLNALGQPETAIFLQALSYKCVLAPPGSDDPPSSQIFTADNYYGPAFSTIAQVQTVLGSPNGTLAGTAGSVGVPASVAWDATNRILYICTTTGSAATAVWTAVNAGSAAAVVTEPQGRLTLTSGVPVLTTDVTGAVAIYYTPYIGNLVPIYNGSSFSPITFSERTLTLHSSHAINTNYDVFVFNNSGVPVIVTGPAWSSDTGRGTGAGTTQITRINGLLVNSVSMTGRNGSTTYSIGANVATYVGTFRASAAGQTQVKFGSSAANGGEAWLGLWNCYNRRPAKAMVTDSSASWNYTSSTIRSSNNSNTNRISLVSGLAEDAIPAQYMTRIVIAVGAAGLSGGRTGLAMDATNAFDKSGLCANLGPVGGPQISNALVVHCKYAPQIGFHFIQATEQGDASIAATFAGAAEQGLMADFMM